MSICCCHSSKNKPGNTTHLRTYSLEKEFAETTSCHGISYWYSSEYNWLKTFWVILVIGMSSVLVSQVTTRIQAYLEFKTSTEVTENFVTSLEFPSVTVCSFNRYFFSENQELLESVYALNQLTSSSFVAYSVENNLTLETLDIEYLGEDFNISAFTDKYGFSIDGTNLIHCNFKSQKCSLDDFKPIFTSLGKCYTFNEGRKKRSQNIPGSGHGLQMILNAQQDNYTEEPYIGADEAGIRIQVHPKSEVPDVETFGLAVPVGHKVYIEVSRTDNVLMNEPWGQCNSEKERNLKYFKKYTLSNCMNECYTDDVIATCGCRLYTQFWASTRQECSLKNMSECASQHLITLKQKYSSEDCGCTVPCSFTKYGVTTAYATFPGKSTLLSLESTFNTDSETIKRNAIELEVYFGSLSYHTFEQSKKITESSLISDIGGQLGLWVGMSSITLIEFFQYFVKRIWRCVRQRRITRVEEINGRSIA